MSVTGRKAVVNYAMTLRGTPYRWGKESPNEGFDCSGFVQHVFSRYGLRLPRTARQMANHLLQIDQGIRQPGDLVFFNTTGEPYSHVGIYIGNDAFVHSSSVRGQVIVSALNGQYWLERLLGFRRPGFREMQMPTR
ncbi:MAG: C40 family peptidase [Methylococcaceae bacterium]